VRRAFRVTGRKRDRLENGCRADGWNLEDIALNLAAAPCGPTGMEKPRDVALQLSPCCSASPATLDMCTPLVDR